MSSTSAPLAGHLLTVEDVADRLGLDVRAVYRLVESRRIEHMRVVRKLRFTEAAISDYLASVTVPAQTVAEPARRELHAVPAPTSKARPRKPRPATKPAEGDHRFVVSW